MNVQLYRTEIGARLTRIKSQATVGHLLDLLKSWDRVRVSYTWRWVKGALHVSLYYAVVFLFAYANRTMSTASDSFRRLYQELQRDLIETARSQADEGNLRDLLEMELEESEKMKRTAASSTNMFG